MLLINKHSRLSDYATKLYIMLINRCSDLGPRTNTMLASAKSNFHLLAESQNRNLYILSSALYSIIIVTSFLYRQSLGLS